jgi:hypothetical protein
MESLLMRVIRCNTSPNVFSCIQGIPEQTLFAVIQEVGHAAAPLPSSTFP